MLLISTGINAAYIVPGTERRECEICGVGILIAPAGLRLMEVDLGLKAVCLTCGLWHLEDGSRGPYVAASTHPTPDSRETTAERGGIEGLPILSGAKEL